MRFYPKNNRIILAPYIYENILKIAVIGYSNSYVKLHEHVFGYLSTKCQ